MTKSLKYLSISILVVLLFSAVLPICFVSAEEIEVIDFDSSSVIDDLTGSTIWNETFDISNYPVDETGSMRILAFTEFAFSLLEQYQQYYGLYIYIYNPQGFEIDDSLNTIKFADEYNSSNEPTNWNNYPLKLLSKDENNVLYKFKVLDCEEHSIVDTFARVALSLESRRYDINSIELHKKGDINAVDYGIGGTWTFSGFGKGMHETSVEESTLTSTATFKNSVEINVFDTYYRYWYGGFILTGENNADQVSSVYFSVPNNIAKEYDFLSAIKFQAYKYLTAPIVVVYSDNNSLFIDEEKVIENLTKQVGVSQEEITSWDEYTWLKWDFGPDLLLPFPHPFKYHKYYCQPNHLSLDDSARWSKNYDILSWLFTRHSTAFSNVDKTALRNWMVSYSENRTKDVLGKYSSDLFDYDYGDIGTTICADDSFSLTGTNIKSPWKNYLHLIFNSVPDDTEEPVFNPIVEVKPSDLSGLTEQEISDNFLVAQEDVSIFTNHVSSYSSNFTTYLFRFDVDIYYSSELNVENYSGNAGYVVQEPVYLDFDIISLTYDKAGVKTVLPVVSSPIDIIADIEPPITEPDWTLEIENMFSNAMTSFFTVVFGLVAILGFVLLAIVFLKYLFGRR